MTGSSNEAGRCSSVRVLLALAGLTLACAKGAPSSATPAPRDVLEAVRASKVVRVGIGYMTPPMNFLDDKGEPAGFDVDLARALAGRMGLDARFTKVNNKTRITSLVSGEVDMVLSNINHTVGRDRQIDFTETYLRDGKRILARKGQFSSLKDFVGRRVAVTQGSNAQQAVGETLKKLGDADPQVVSFQNDAECFLALKTGKVEGYTNDTVILVGVSGGDRAFEPASEIFSPTYYAIGVPENQSKWRDELNFTLRALVLDGTYQRVYDRWFGADGPYPLPDSSRITDVWAD
jgi:polar amino acid transport system substrate-binding protein